MAKNKNKTKRPPKEKKQEEELPFNTPWISLRGGMIIMAINFSKVFLTALYPFAIVKDGKTYNYYDEKLLAENLRPAISWNIKKQIDFGARRDLAIILGKKNADCFKSINDECGFFKKINSLEHPRYIMQYRLKKAEKYIDKYISATI